MSSTSRVVLGLVAVGLLVGCALCAQRDSGQIFTPKDVLHSQQHTAK